MKVFVSLPIRMFRPGVMGAPVALSATPKARTYSPLPGAERETMTPGTSASFITLRTAVSSSAATAGVSFGNSSAAGVAAATAEGAPASHA